MTVNKVSFTTCGNEPSPGDTFLVTNITIDNVDDSGFDDYGAFAWSVTDSTGTSYDAALWLPSCVTPVSDDPTLNPGVTVTVTQVFEIPGTATGLTLLWQGKASISLGT